ncbi:MAG: hypothetical protein ABSG78_14040 [Verrucomicrobiota bacterium]
MLDARLNRPGAFKTQLWPLCLAVHALDGHEIGALPAGRFRKNRIKYKERTTDADEKRLISHP